MFDVFLLLNWQDCSIFYFVFGVEKRYAVNIKLLP